MLDPLSQEHVHEIIEQRYKLLAAPGKSWIKPVEDKVINYFYDTIDGKIRYVMNGVTSLVSHLPDSFADTLTLAKASELLIAIQMSEIEARLSKVETEVLIEAIKLRRLTPSALVKETEKSKQLIQKYLNKLLSCSYVYHTEKIGRRQYYEVDPRFHLLTEVTGH